MQSDILFDNIYIGHSVEDANKLAEESFKPKHAVEKALAEADAPKPDEPKSPNDLKFLDDPVLFIREKIDLFITIAQTNPIEAVKFVPEVAGGIVAIVLTVVAILSTLLMGGSAPPAVKKAAGDVKAKAKDVKDKAAEAVASGAEKAKTEAKKRNARNN